MSRIHQFPAVGEPASAWEQFTRAIGESAREGWDRGKRRAAIRRQARQLSTPAMEEMLHSIECDLIARLQTRHDAGRRVVRAGEIAQVMADWQTVRGELTRRERGR